jgi:hypothetical protein
MFFFIEFGQKVSESFSRKIKLSTKRRRLYRQSRLWFLKIAKVDTLMMIRYNLQYVLVHKGRCHFSPHPLRCEHRGTRAQIYFLSYTYVVRVFACNLKVALVDTTYWWGERKDAGRLQYNAAKYPFTYEPVTNRQTLSKLITSTDVKPQPEVLVLYGLN